MSRWTKGGLLGLVALAILLMALPAGAQPPVWNQVTCSDGGFTVMAPGTPVVKTRQFEFKTSYHAYGAMERKEYIMKGAGSVFRASYFDLPDDLLQRGGPAHILGVIADARLRRVQSEPVSRSSISLGSHEGLAIVRRLTNGVTLNLRMYLVGNRCYELMVAQRNPRPAVVSRFMDSFKLMGK